MIGKLPSLSSPTPKDRALRQLERIAQYNAADAWDGDNAVGVKEDIVEWARVFIGRIPESCLPEYDDMGVDVDGEILGDYIR